VEITRAAIPDVLVIEPRVHRDARGWFVETYQEERFRAAGIDASFVQDNHARSVKGTLRGLHYQTRPGQAKLVRVTRGRVFDVAVDIRRSSPTFGRWSALELGEDELKLVFIPVGFAHGYAALSDTVEVQYKCTSLYDPSTEAGIAYDDPDLAIPWPLASPILSDRDRVHPRLRDAADLPP
jgi:dTDP-4-dehydrorhamnose 3,5-epimerase